MTVSRHQGPPALQPPWRKGHSRYPSTALPTPPDDTFPDSGLSLDLRHIAGLRHAPPEDVDVASPSDSYPQMTLKEKVREANHAVVHQWGRFLVGAVISELVDHASPAQHAISVMDLPTNFCVSPIDELLCPSDDPMRVIVVVSAAGRIVDTGIFDLDGPLFYHGFIVDNHYTPAPPAPPSPL
ncbi:hypothetical protein H4R21_005716 [Coemansia helicoidea]|uniref:Uncharacterized protein n=1 Tax=Coemansia helicoidea TaxID=1286919 RepID=A0ACC1KR49_9FUNG|nr:hypothetical protein H4R21_005716 [Coemansia helicoidea]